MKLKSFYAGTVEAALGLARDELGPEAILVNSRKAPPEAQHLGQYEVVAAAMSPDQPRAGSLFGPAGSAAAALGPEGAGRGKAEVQLSREMAELRRQMERMRKAIWQSSLSRASGLADSSSRSGVLPSLLEAGLDPQLAQEIAACVAACLAGDPLLDAAQNPRTPPPPAAEAEEPWGEVLRAELERRFSVEPVLGQPGARPKIVALVGPPGAGKSATLAKLAVNFALRRGHAAQILSMDTYRIAATEPVRTYAAVLGVGFQALETGPALRQALSECLYKDLVLIDTPGYGPRDMEAASELAAILAPHPEIDVHLVLAATTKSADLTSAVDRFEIFRPGKLLFTRVDETSVFGPAFSEAVRTAKPISFLATGQSVPEDLEEARKDRIVELILERSI
jgi:flagellar biosynthesis protein FlhF